MPFVITTLGRKVSVTLTSEFGYSPSFAAYNVSPFDYWATAISNGILLWRYVGKGYKWDRPQRTLTFGRNRVKKIGLA